MYLLSVNPRGIEETQTVNYSKTSVCQEAIYGKALQAWSPNHQITREVPQVGLCVDFLDGSDGKVSVYSAGDLGLIPGWGRSPEEGNGNPLQ